MFSVTGFKLLVAAILFVSLTTAFIPVTNGPTLDAKQGRIAGIGGIDGPKPPTSGGIGSFKVGSKSKGASKKETPKKAVSKGKAGGIGSFFKSKGASKKEASKKTLSKAKAGGKKATKETKKQPNLWIKTPWSK